MFAKSYLNEQTPSAGRGQLAGLNLPIPSSAGYCIIALHSLNGAVAGTAPSPVSVAVSLAWAVVSNA